MYNLLLLLLSLSLSDGWLLATYLIGKGHTMGKCMAANQYRTVSIMQHKLWEATWIYKIKLRGESAQCSVLRLAKLLLLEGIETVWHPYKQWSNTCILHHTFTGAGIVHFNPKFIPTPVGKNLALLQKFPTPGNKIQYLRLVVGLGQFMDGYEI